MKLVLLFLPRGQRRSFSGGHQEHPQNPQRNENQEGMNTKGKSQSPKVKLEMEDCVMEEPTKVEEVG